MCLDPGLKAMPDRADIEIHAFQRTERALDLGESLLTDDGLLGRHLCVADAGADHIKAIQRRFGRHPCLAHAELERSVTYLEIKVLTYLVAGDHLTNPHTDFIAALKAAGSYNSANLFQLACCCRNQVLTLVRTQPGKGRITAGDQSLTRIVVMGQGEQISFVEKVQLQLSGIGQLRDGPALAGGDPIDPVKLRHGVNLDPGDRAAVADHDALPRCGHTASQLDRGLLPRCGVTAGQGSTRQGRFIFAGATKGSIHTGRLQAGENWGKHPLDRIGRGLNVTVSRHALIGNHEIGLEHCGISEAVMGSANR